MATSFEVGQRYAAKQDGERWEYIAELSEGDEIELLTDNGVQVGTFHGVVPRNRSYPIIVALHGIQQKASLATVVIESDYEWARDEYLDNLRRRTNKQPFGGLPQWQKQLLKASEEVLPDDMCDELEITRGSTIGYSVTKGKHFPCVYVGGGRA